MLRRVRSIWVAVAAVSYVAFAALRMAGGHGLPWLALVLLPIGLVVGWRITEPRGALRVEPAARSATRACLTGAAILLAARSGPIGPGFTALSNLGAAIAAMSALVAMARIASQGGLLEAPPSTRRLDAAAFGALLWTIAVALPAAEAAWPARASGIDPLAADYATVCASIGSLGLGLAAMGRVRALRRLELGASDRSLAALSLTATALAVSVLASFAGLMAPELLLPIAVVVAAIAQSWAAVASDATRVARALRTILAVVTLASPFALFAVYAAHETPGRAGPAVFICAIATAIAGLAAPLLSQRFAPVGARWLVAFDRATRAAMNPDPDVALESALAALREAAGPTSSAGSTAQEGQAPPTLYRLDPAEAVTVNRGGFAQVQKAEVPARLLALADEEPERILRLEVLRAVEVRRPDVRPIIAWLERRGIAAAAVVRDDDEAIAVLTIPRGDRSTAMSLDEARALGALADRMGAVVGVSSMLARSRDRELANRAEKEELSAEVTRLLALGHRDAERREAIARSIERPARVASYSPAARAALEELERVGVSGRPVTLLTTPGTDTAAWAALVHLASARRGEVLLLVDGTSAAEHDLARWRDPIESPLRVASGGTLVILDAHALPQPVQTYLAAALTDDVALVIAVPATMDSLVAAGRIEERLADRVGDRAVAIPALALRGEDLRPLAHEHLSRLGMRLRGKPLGLDVQALDRLGDHSWPGNDAELYAVLLRAALVAEGDVVTRADPRRSGSTRSPALRRERPRRSRSRAAVDRAAKRARRRSSSLRGPPRRSSRRARARRRSRRGSRSLRA